MSGPIDPFDGDAADAGAGGEAGAELPWPQPEPESEPVPDGEAESHAEAETGDEYPDEIGRSEDGVESRTARRAVRSARVRRRTLEISVRKRRSAPVLKLHSKMSMRSSKSHSVTFLTTSAESSAVPSRGS